MKYLIDFKNNTADATIQQYFTDHNITVIRQFDKLGLVYEVSADSMPPATDIIEYVIDDEAAPISLLNRDTVSFDSTVDSNWWKLATLDLHDYDKPTITHIPNKKYISVYIVDSGITASHPEFAGVNVENVYSYDGTFDDINGHGTAIASIVGGNTCSLANTDIKVVKIFGNTPTLQSHLLAAFDAIITHSSASIYPSIVNLSWIIDKNSFIESKIQKLIDNKVTVVCAAGNSGAPIPNVTPASMPDVVTVGAYNQDFEPCDFSNYTSGIAVTGGTVNYGAIDVWAPGVNILAASTDGSYHLVSGTSIASAIHSMACAFAYGLDLSMDDPEFMMSTNWFQHFITSPAAMKALASLRENILTLQGVYAESVNRITTIFSKLERPANYVRSIHDTIVAGKTWEQVLYYKIYVNSAELEQPLPPGLELKEGFIIGAVDPSYLDGQDYKLFNTTLNAQTVLGENVSSDIRILIKKAEEVVAEAIDDPEIIVFLQSGPGCPNMIFCQGNYCNAPAKFDRCVGTIKGTCNCFGA